MSTGSGGGGSSSRTSSLPFTTISVRLPDLLLEELKLLANERSCEVAGAGSRAPEETGKPTEIP
jgi:hypothetical protein